MKKLTVAISIIVALLFISDTGFAQQKRRTKKKRTKITKPSIEAPTISLPTIAAKPCKEEEVAFPGPYTVVAGSDEKPPTVKIPCPKPGDVTTTPLKILSKPKANYTDAARANNVNGKVVLRVTFHKSGIISAVTPISGLPFGLTEQAVNAAKQIRFEPEKQKGVPVTTTKTVEYNFTLY